MARVTEGLNLNGTMGKLVFYQRNGKNYVRTKPATYRDAKTETQLLARGRFAGCNSFYSLLRDDIFRLIWKVAATGTGKNAKNLFMQHNTYAFGKDKNIEDYSRVHFSTGMLPLPNGLEFARYNNRECLLQWEYDAPKALGSPADRLYIVELHTADLTADLTIRMHETDICRSEGKALFSTFYDVDEQTHLYCFWGNEQCTSFSADYYSGAIRLIAP